MDLRAITGYIALALLLGYWIWVLSSTTPELRRGTRDRDLRVKILLVKTAALVLTALVVATVHFWATQVWHVLVAVPIAAAAAYGLRKAYRRLVAAPRHRLPLGQRIRRSGHLQVITPPGGRQPAHRVVVPAPRPPTDAVPPPLGSVPSVGTVPPLDPAMPDVPAVSVADTTPVPAVAPTDGPALGPQVRAV